MKSLNWKITININCKFWWWSATDGGARPMSVADGSNIVHKYQRLRIPQHDGAVGAERLGIRHCVFLCLIRSPLSPHSPCIPLSQAETYWHVRKHSNTHADKCTPKHRCVTLPTFLLSNRPDDSIYTLQRSPKNIYHLKLHRSIYVFQNPSIC